LQLKELADVVVIDAPPVLGLGDSSAVASKVDGILFVVKANAATKREVHDAAEQLRKAGGRIIGSLLNAVARDQGYGYYYNYYYSQYQGKEPEAEAPRARKIRRGPPPPSSREIPPPSSREIFEWNRWSDETVLASQNPPDSDGPTRRPRFTGRSKQTGQATDRR
jgi:hypothetical protein